MAANNFKRFDLGIQIAPGLPTDPLTGRKGEIYYNTTRDVLRFCHSESPLSWQDLFIDGGTVNSSTLRWDTAADAWLENIDLLINSSTISTADAATPLDLNLVAGDATGIDQNGADISVTPGTGTGTGRDGMLMLNTDLAKAFVGGASFALEGSDTLAVDTNGGDLLLTGGAGLGTGLQGKVVATGREIDLFSEVVKLSNGQAADPLTGAEGQVYYSQTLKTFKYHDGSIWRPLGGTGIVAVTLRNAASTTLPTGNPVVIDNVTVNAGDLVLFTALSSGNNVVYKAVGIGTNITSWTTQLLFSGSAIPTDGSMVAIQQGASFEDQLALYTSSKWVMNERVRYFNDQDYFEQSSLYTITVADATTDDVFVVGYSASENLIVDYSLKRGSAKETGTIYLSTDGTSVAIATDGVYLGTTGVEFSADILGTDLRLRYTSTATGMSGAMKFNIRRWSDAAGGPAGPPTYIPGGGGGGGGASGTSGAVQLSDGSGNFTNNTNFKYDLSNNVMKLGDMHTAPMSGSLTINDNQVAPLTLLTFAAATYPSVIVEYSIERGGDRRTGRILIAGNGSTCNYNDDFVTTGVTDTYFSVTGGATISLQYTSDSTGSAGVFRYSVRKWN